MKVFGFTFAFLLSVQAMACLTVPLEFRNDFINDVVNRVLNERFMRVDKVESLKVIEEKVIRYEWVKSAPNQCPDKETLGAKFEITYSPSKVMTCTITATVEKTEGRYEGAPEATYKQQISQPACTNK